MAIVSVGELITIIEAFSEQAGVSTSWALISPPSTSWTEVSNPTTVWTQAVVVQGD